MKFPRVLVYAVILSSLAHSIISLIIWIRSDAPPTITLADNATSHQMKQMAEWLTAHLHERKRGEMIDAPTVKTLQAGLLFTLSFMFQSKVLPYKTPRYPATKGVLDRLPLESFMRKAAAQERRPRDYCLEWGPFFKGWRGTTQPYLKLFNCSHKWMFAHDPDAKSARMHSSNSIDQFGIEGVIKGDLDTPLLSQGLHKAVGMFDLVIIPQTLQYSQDPQKAISLLFDLLRPDGILLITAPYVQITLPYEIKGSNRQSDYWRFTVEGLEHLLRGVGFEIEESFVGGSRLAAICWLLECGQTDLEVLPGEEDTLIRKGKDYSYPAYMISMTLARKPSAI